MKLLEPRGKILVVDDTSVNLLLLIRILESRGYFVEGVDNGKSAIEKAITSSPDLILLDIAMAGMDGYETCAQLKVDERTRNIPIIFISALDDVDAKVKAFQAGGVDYITKPVGMEEVEARVDIHLANKILQSQLKETNSELALRIKELTFSQSLVQERESKLQAFINALPNQSFIYDEEGHYLEVLSAQFDLLTASVEDLKCHTIKEMMPEDIALEMMQVIHRTIETGATQVMEYKLNVMDGSEHWFEGRSALMEKGDAGHGKVVFIVTEVSERVRLYQEVQHLATLDSLTGCLNRRHFLTLANQELERTIRYQRPLSLLMLDIDHFKIINDTYGHAVGDKVLCSLVDLCRSNLRNVDIISRHGGEEFIILLPETQKDTAFTVAERLRGSVEKMQVMHSEQKISITVSIGISSVEIQPGKIESVELLIHRADMAMYDAKTTRNAVKIR
jgi:diguanylate cyclase (GGDEF)-like protein/PAS domain S-box-containing protein